MFHINNKGIFFLKKLVSLVFFVLICLDIVYGQELSVKINPETVELGGAITINIKPETSFYNILYVYKIDDTYITSISVDCEEQCSEERNVNFVIPYDWKAGNYYIEVFDYNKGDYLKRGFAVREKSNCFYVSQTGGGSHNGGKGNEFNLSEAQAYANSHTNEEITFLLASGNYGIFEDNTERTAWATWKALDYINKPVFSKIHIENSVKRNMYARFDGINITSKPGLPYPGTKKGLVYISASNYVEFLNCIMFHYKRYASEDVTPYLNGDYLKINNCEIYSPEPEPSECYTTQPSATRGMEVWRVCNHVEITNNKIHDFGKSGIYIYSGSKVYNLLIENNTIYNHRGHPPPCDPENPPDYLHGRAIVLENSAGSVIIRNNIIHSYSRGIGMYTYAATNLTIESNLFYNLGQPIDYKGNGDNARGIGPGSKIINNTIISIYDSKQVKTGYYSCGSYGEAIAGGSLDSSYDGSFELKNNLMIGKVDIGSNIISSGNIIFCPANAGYANSKVYCTSCSQGWGSITNGWDPENDFFVNYLGNDFRPLMSSHICDGSVNGKPEIAVGVLPCVCLNDSHCIFGGECINGKCIGEKNCLGTIKSCGGSFPDCVNCDLLDGCYGNSYRNYNNCTAGSCSFISDDCSDCSCSCGIYGTSESNFCNDKIDNDCDGCIDNTDSDCGGTETVCSDRGDNDCDSKIDCQDSDCATDPYCQSGFPPDYVSHWKFEGNAIDEMWVKNGTVQGNSQFAPGIEGQGIAFDGNNDYVSLPNDFLDSYSVGTISAWVKTNASSYQCILCANNGESKYRSQNSFGITSSGKLNWYTQQVNSPVVLINLNGTATLNDNSWHHVVVVVDNTKTYLYVDGVLDISSLGSYWFNDGVGSTGGTGINYIGALWYGTSSQTGQLDPTWEMKGAIDNVVIYNRALNQSEIQQIYCSQGGSAEFCVEAPENLRTDISQYGITWYFDKNLTTNGAGNTYQYGQFANGDYWVVGPVNITRITPDFDGQHHGWQVNPSPGSSQGFDYRISTFNSKLVPNLQYTAYPNESIVKTISIEPLNKGCKPCLEVAAVLTVLEKAPPEGSFRPPYVGSNKTFYNVNQLKTNLLPSLQPTQNTPTLNSIKSAFQKVQLDHKVGWACRWMHPKQNMPDYGSSIAIRNADGALRLMLNDSIENKMPALINYVQMGIDFYGILKNGGYWQGDGGNQEGRKLPIAFAATLLDNQEMKDAVSKAAPDGRTFGENSGIRFSQKGNYGKGIALFAQVDYTVYFYWRILANNSAPGSKTQKDPYGYIDGGMSPGVSYLSCCLSQPWKATSLAVRLMPEVRKVWNDEYFHDFSDRYADFGIWTQPDPCAPPTGECSTTKIPCTLANKSVCTGGQYCDTASKFRTDYGVKYGPDPTNSSNCILDTDFSDGIGRAPKLHGTNTNQDYYGSAFSNKMWYAYRKIYSCIWVYDNVTNWHYDCSSCLYNCLSGPYCGDGNCNGGENSTSCEFDCVEALICGNNIKESGETCDGTDLAGENCITQGFDSGTLACLTNCLSYDTSVCVEIINLPNATTFDGNTTNFSIVPDINAVPDAVLEKTSYGKINFSGQTLNFANLDLDSYVVIEDNKVGIDINNLPNLNVSSILSIYDSFNNPKILENGVSCYTGGTHCNIIEHTANLVKFTVDHFSNFSVMEETGNVFYVSVSGAGSHNGSLGNEMNLSNAQGYADLHLKDNIIFMLEDGNYGSVIFASNNNRTASVTYKSVNKQKAVFETLKIGKSGGRIEQKLTLDSISVIRDPIVKPEPTGYWISGYSFGSIQNSADVTIKNSYFKGFDKYVVIDFGIQSSNNIWLLDNEAKTFRGNFPYVSNSKNIYIINNNLSEIAVGSIIRIMTGCRNIVIKGNIIVDCNVNSKDKYFPYNTTGTSAYHPGSVFAMRSDDFIIDGNIVHDCHIAQTIKTYDAVGSFSNLIIQNNLFYDTNKHQIWNLEPTTERPIIIRNNTFIGGIRVNGTGKYDISQRYGDTVGFRFINNSYVGFQFYNNIVNGQWVLPGGDIQQDNNVFYVNDVYGKYERRGQNTIFAVWMTPSGNTYLLHGYPNFFEDIGYRGGTQEYNYNNDGFTSFFVNPGFYFSSEVSNKDSRRYDLDFHPLINSVICNGGYLYGERLITNAVADIASAGALPCVCTENSQCQEVFGNDSTCDSKTQKCVVVTQTCSQQNGYICSETEYCSGNKITASDTERCCDVPCMVPSWTNCSECGSGLFNICDKDECNSILEGCYYEGRFVCTSCSKLNCESYTNMATCVNDSAFCGFGNCVWNGSSCVISIVNKTNQISQYGITWTFDKEYEYGQFANGDYWVVGPVNITRITPDFDGQHHGWQVNPSPGSSQGFDYRISTFNSKLVPNLTYTAYPNKSIVKTISINPLNDTSCRPCLEVAAVLTVLEKAPPKGSFRPPYVGTNKTFYNVNQLKTDLLPSLEPTQNTPTLNSIKSQFQKVQLDHKYEWSGRSMHPKQNMPDYGSSIAIRNANGALRLMLNDSISDKMPALINYIQMGIDFYGILKNGGSWPGDGGHQEGRKLPIAFAAVLLDNQEMKDAVNKAGADSKTFGENNGIRFRQQANNGAGIALYAQIDDSGYYYWKKLADNSASGSKTYKDPYGYIDGGQTPGSSYLGCCLSQPWKATSLAVRLIPEVRSVWNDEAFHDFSDRYADFGIWTQPDPCAPPTGECNTTKIPCTLANKSVCTGGQYCNIASKFSTDYGVKYGPDPNNPGNCILDTDPSDGIGRVPKSHGANKNSGYYGSDFANNMWNTYRKEYSCIWSYNNTNNWHYDCSQCQYNCLSSPYCGDGICDGNETSENCAWDCVGAPSCTDDTGCTSEGSFCEGNMPYTCSLVGDGCLDRVDRSDCDDGLYCNGLETCLSGSCQKGIITIIDDNMGCTIDNCNEDTDIITHITDDSLCSDGLWCNGAEYCDANLGCKKGAAPNCDDSIGCTIDSCYEGIDLTDNAGVCEHDTASCKCKTNDDCNDDNPCTDDICTAQLTCQNVNDDSNTCNNGLWCTINDRCSAGSCIADSRAVDDNVSCTADSCDEENDKILHIADNTKCEDGLYCNGQEVCDIINDCQAGVAPSVDDNVSCTIDNCNEDTDIITHITDDSLCLNGLYCNGNEYCDANSGCKKGAAPNCDDGIAYTIDSCNDGIDLTDNAGICRHYIYEFPMDYISYWRFEGNANDESRINNGRLIGDTTIVIDKDEARGQVLSLDGDKDYVDCGNDLSLNLMGPLTLSAWIKPKWWGGDGKGKIIDKGKHGISTPGGFVFGITNSWLGRPNVSTYVNYGGWIDTSDAYSITLRKWQHVVLVWNQSGKGDIAFYIDGVKKGSRNYSGAHTGDGNPRDSSSYPLVIGIRWQDMSGGFNGSIDDVMIFNRALTETEIQGLYHWQSIGQVPTCQSDTDCNDNNPCTDDICTAKLTCQNVNDDNNTCNNGLWCSINDRCSAGSCIADSRAVDDNVGCTLDSCDEDNDKLLHIADNSLCGDGLYCNGAEYCDANLGCKDGVAPAIDDNISCTIDNCNEDTDMITHTADDSLCLDGLWCNGQETCDANSGCKAGVSISCDDKVACTDDVCNEDKDLCESMPNNAKCDDDKFCNGAEYCDVNLDCQNGTQPICNDGIDCTLDYCDSVLNKCVFDDNNCMDKCDLILAYWSTDTAIEGEIVNLIAEGTNCENKEVNFSIYENDITLDDYINDFSSIFTKNKSIAWWKASYEPDAGTDPEYYFIAALTEDSSVNKQSDLMTVQKGCKEKWQEVYSICLINDTKMKYYMDDNKCGTTYNPPLDNGIYVSCDYCSGDIEGPFIEQSECTNGTIYRTTYYTDLNYLSCCLVTFLDSDCHILNKKYQNKTDMATCEGDDDYDGAKNLIDRCPYTNITKLNVSLAGKSQYNGRSLINIYGCPLPIADKFSPESTSNLVNADLLNLDNFSMGIPNKGEIKFMEKVVLVDVENGYNQINLDDNIDIQQNLISINSDNLKMLNKKARLKLYNLNFTNPKVLKDNNFCLECSIKDYINGTLVFNVEGFTNYSAAETICGDKSCDPTESCSDCSVDCGSCPSAGGGGRGIGVRGIVGVGEAIATGEACNYNWRCGDWSDCAGGIKTRSCVNIGTCPDDDKTPKIKEECKAEEITAPEKEPVESPGQPSLLDVDSKVREDKIEIILIINNPEKEAMDGLEIELNINYEKTTKILDYIPPFDVKDRYIITKTYDIEKLKGGEYTINARLYRKGTNVEVFSEDIHIDEKKSTDRITGEVIGVDRLGMKVDNKSFVSIILTILLIMIAIYAKIKWHKPKKRG